LNLTSKGTNPVNYIHNPEIHNFSAAKQILPFLLSLKPVDSVLDVGCGTGTWLKIASDLGVKEVLGIDGVPLNTNELHIPADSFINDDLTRVIDLKRKFDLLICLEVAEHLPAENAKNLVDSLTNHSDFIVFSAAIPGQGGQNHINEQWPVYWQTLFFNKGYYPCEILRDIFWNDNEIEWWYRQNILIFAPESVLLNLNLTISKEVRPLIHPDLFIEKLDVIQKLNNMIEREIWKPSFKSAFKRLIKSIIN